MNHEIVPEHKSVDGDVLRTMLVIAAIPAIFLTIGSIAVFGGLATFYGALGLLGIGAGFAVYLKVSHHRMKKQRHKQDMADRELKRELSAAALNNDYCVH